MPDDVRVLDAVKAGRQRDAADLIFEYIVATQVELGHSVPAHPADLPPSLRSECSDPGSTYPAPGTVLLAEAAGAAIGCVALRYVGSGTAEVKRLFVRPSHRGGVGRVLMTQLHEHADRHRLRLVLDVLPTRTHVIALYEDLGYRSTPSGSTAAPLVVMERIGVPRGG